MWGTSKLPYRLRGTALFPFTSQQDVAIAALDSFAPLVPGARDMA